MSTENIAEALWGDEQPAKAEGNISSLVSRLRATFGTEAILGRRPGYTLATGAWADTDVQEAERLTAQAEARVASNEPSLAAVAAEQAIAALGTGRILEEEPDAPWAEQTQRSVDLLLSRARRASWTAALTLRDPATAVRVAEAAIAATPLEEQAYRALMHARLQAGASGAALEVYERLRTVLAEELGVDPSPETQALHLSILRGEGAVAEVPPVRPSQWTGDPGFVAREEELARLARRWEAAAGGQPALIVVAGEAGIGKTRLAREAVRLTEATGGQVLESRCFEQERSLFLQPILDALRSALMSKPSEIVRDLVGDRAGTISSLLPEVSRILRPIGYQPAPPEIERRRSFEAVTSTLQELARRQPLLLFLDDLHNAGASSLELLHFLIRRATTDRMLVVGTLRTEEGAEALAQLEDVAELVRLGPLSEEGVARLAELMGSPDLTERILRLSRGHPLFVVEALRAMAESAGEDQATPLPHTLRTAVLSRARRTGPDVEEFLRAAATLGPAFDLTATAGLLGVPIEEAMRRAERALRAHLLAEAGGMYEFANELIQEVLYQTTPLPTRIQRHRRAAALLRDNPEAVGAHAVAAEDWELAADAWLQAAERASLRFSNRDAERMLDHAIVAARTLGDRAREASALVARGRAREGLAEFQRAFDDHTAAVELGREAGHRGVEMRALRELGGDLLVGMGRPARDCIPYLQAGLAISEELGDRPEQVDFLNRLAVIWVNLLRFDLAYDHVGRALDIARDLGDDRALAVALDGMKTAAAYSGDLPTLDEVAPQLESMFRRRGDLWYLQWTVFESSFSPMARGQWERAEERLQEALALNVRTGLRNWRSSFVSHLGWLERSQGNYGKALRFGREAVDVAQEVGHPWWMAFSGAMLGWTLTELFALDEAVEVLERALVAAERDGSESYLVRCLAHLALARWERGDRDHAIQRLERAETILDGVTVPPGSAFLHGGHAYLAAANVWLGLHDWDRAERLATTVLEPAERVGWEEIAAGASVVIGRCRQGAGDLPGAKAYLLRAAQRAESIGLPRVAWEGHAALAKLARTERAKAEADHHASRARAIARRLAATIDDPELRRTFERRGSATAERR